MIKLSNMFNKELIISSIDIANKDVKQINDETIEALIVVYDDYVE